MILEIAIQQSECSLHLDNKLDLKKNPVNRGLQKCGQKVMLFFTDQINHTRQTRLLLKMEMFNWRGRGAGGKEGAVACKLNFVCNNFIKIAGMFSETFS